MGSQASARRRKVLNGGEGGLREGEPARKVGRSRVFLREPVAEPTEALGRVKKLTIKVNRGGTGGPRRVPLFGGVPMYKFCFGDAEGYLPLSSLRLN